MEETFIDIAGVHIQEPVTVITNTIMVFICLWFYHALKKPGSQNTGKFWGLFFLFFSLNSLAGLILHGFNSYFPEAVNIWGWKLLNNLLNVPCAYALLRANVEISDTTEEKRKKLNLYIVVSSVVFTLLIITINKFWVGMINASLAMLITFIHYLALNKRKAIYGAGIIAFGFGFSFLSVGIHAGKLSLSQWFNHKDISHVIIIIALIIIHRGVEKTLLAEQDNNNLKKVVA